MKIFGSKQVKKTFKYKSGEENGDGLVTLRKHLDSVTRQVLKWNPQGKRKRGHPKNTWRRDAEAEMKSWGHTWNTLERLAQDRTRWRKEIVHGPCSRRS